MIPEAHIHGALPWPARLRAARRWRRDSRGGRVATWSASLGAVQAALLLASAGDHVETLPALVGLSVVLSLIAAIVVGTVWFVRFAVRAGGRPVAIGLTAAFYGASALAAPGGSGLLAATLLAPAIVWSWWLPSGSFAVTSCARR